MPESKPTTSIAVPSQSSVVLSDQAAALLDHLTSAINDDIELPTVLRNEGGLRREAAELYLAVDRFHRKLKRLAGDEEGEHYVCQPDRNGYPSNADLHSEPPLSIRQRAAVDAHERTAEVG